VTDLDLNAARAARAEARGESSNVLVVGDDRYALPAEMPAAVLDGFMRANAGDFSGVIDALRLVFGTRTELVDSVVEGEPPIPVVTAIYDELVVTHHLTMDDLVWVLEHVMSSYGVTLGESSGSPTSSTGGGTPSSPTSAATT